VRGRNLKRAGIERAERGRERERRMGEKEGRDRDKESVFESVSEREKRRERTRERERERERERHTHTHKHTHIYKNSHTHIHTYKHIWTVPNTRGSRTLFRLPSLHWNLVAPGPYSFFFSVRHEYSYTNIHVGSRSNQLDHGC